MQRIHRGTLAALSLAVALALPTAAAAGLPPSVFDRPDLLDVSGPFVATSPIGNGTSSNAYVVAQEYFYYGGIGGALGRFAGSTASGAFDINWLLYEPDSVKRTSRGATLTQKKHLAFSVQFMLGATSFSTTGTVEGCSAKVSVKEDRNGDPGAAWQARCNNRAITALLGGLGLTPEQEDQLQALLGLRTLKIRNRGQQLF